MPDEDPNDRPALFIRTYDPPQGFGPDTGIVRPVPNGVIYYVCPGIQVLSAFHPGSPLTVRVEVSNWGGGNSPCIAKVEVWWSPPISGKIVPLEKNRIGTDSDVAVDPFGGTAMSKALTGNIPADSGLHICLLAMVSHTPSDLPPTTNIGGKDVHVADPIQDRHWAQHNLAVVPAAGPQTITFLATNPMPVAGRFALRVQPLSEQKWSVLAESERATPVRTRARFRLSGLDDNAEATGDNTLGPKVLILDAGEHRNMTLSVDLPEPLRPGTFAAYEVLQFKSDRPVGGFGIILSSRRVIPYNIVGIRPL